MHYFKQKISRDLDNERIANGTIAAIFFFCVVIQKIVCHRKPTIFKQNTARQSNGWYELWFHKKKKKDKTQMMKKGSFNNDC